MALIMNLNESFWQSSKKKRKRKLNHSSWTCMLALLQRWRRPTPCVHISKTSLITRSCWQCHVLPAAMSKTAARILPLLDLWQFESQLHAWKRLQDPGTFFQTCCAPFVENARSSSAGRYGRTTNLRLQKHWKRKRKSPGEINVERTGQDR